MKKYDLTGEDMVWLWKTFVVDKETNDFASIISVVEKEAKKTNLSFEDYFNYKKAKYLLEMS